MEKIIAKQFPLNFLSKTSKPMFAFVKKIAVTSLLLGAFWTVQAQCPPPSSTAHHRVQKGESLYRIAKQYGVTVNDLAAWNNMLATDILNICQELRITAAGATATRPPAAATPPAERPADSHVIRSGETIASIAAQYGYTEERFRRMNHLNANEPARPGMVLRTSDCICPPLGGQPTPAYTEAGGWGTTSAPVPTSAPANARSGMEDETANRTVAYDRITSPSGAWGDPETANRPSFHEDPYGIDERSLSSYNDRIGTLVPDQPNTPNIRQQPEKREDPSRGRNNGVVRPDEQLAERRSNTNTTNTTAAPAIVTASSAPYMTAEELAMVNEINLARSNPQAYIPFVEEYMERVRRGQAFGSVATCQELIDELRRTPKLSTLQPAECIFQAAKKHGLDQRPTGSVDHVGTDGSFPWDRVRRECRDMTDGNENIVAGPTSVRDAVILLLVDDGIANRGHRRTLLQADWKFVACYKVGQVGNMPNNWVQLFGK